MAVSRVVAVLMRYPCSEGRVHAGVGLGFSSLVIGFLTSALRRRRTDIGLLWWVWNSLRRWLGYGEEWIEKGRKKEFNWYLYATVVSVPLQYPRLVFLICVFLLICYSDFSNKFSVSAIPKMVHRAWLTINLHLFGLAVSLNNWWFFIIVCKL